MMFPSITQVAAGKPRALSVCEFEFPSCLTITWSVLSLCVRQHALLVVTEKYGPLLIDLEAPNGTFIDGRRLEPYKGARVSPSNGVSFGTSTRRYVFTVDTSADAKKNLALYQVLEDPAKLAALEKADLSVFVR